MSYVQPVVDLWSMKPFAYALTHEDGELYTCGTPRELYQWTDAAYLRDFEPLIVKKIAFMPDDAWGELLRLLPIQVYTYSNGRVTDTHLIMTEEPSTFRQWVRCIPTQDRLKRLLAESVRYGSGAALGVATQLVAQGDVLQVRWI